MTADPYDPLDYETWPEEQKAFAGRVWNGLHNGDLQPLADYLRAGHYIDRSLAGELADAIDSNDLGPFRIIAVGRGRGQKGMTETLELHDRKMRVGVFMEERLRQIGSGGYESAMDDTTKKFGISRATVTKAHKFLRGHLAGKDVQWRAPDHDPWEFAKAFYLTP